MDSTLPASMGVGLFRSDLAVWVAEKLLGFGFGRRRARLRSRLLAVARAAPTETVVDAAEGLGDASADVIVSVMTLHRLDDDAKRRAIAELVRALRPGGRLVVADFQRHGHRAGHAPRVGAGTFGAAELPILMAQAGLVGMESGNLPVSRLPGLPRVGYAIGRAKSL